MKRIKNVYPLIISDENLTKAIMTVCRSHRWRHYPTIPDKTVLWFESSINERVQELRQIIEEGFTPSPVKQKRRYDRNAKKWREISEPQLWPDQCVHHALIQVIEPVMMRGMDRHCCGSIKGRGAHYGIKYIKKWMKEDRKGTRYVLEFDIRHFYDSLSPEIVMNRMRQLIKDSRTLDLIRRVMINGIQIGAYCSQWFANTFLQPLDQIIRQQGVNHYLRYMDNFTIFANRKRTLHRVLKISSEWLKDHGLELKNNWQIFPSNKRLPNALGYRYMPGVTLLRKHSLLTLKRQLRTFYKMRDNGIKITLHFAQSLISRLGMLCHCNRVNHYKRFVQPKTLRFLKDIVRSYARKGDNAWNIFLAQYAETVH